MTTRTGTSTSATSPLSSSPPEKIRDLSKAFLLEKLESYYGVKPPQDIVECDYSLWKCAETGFEFAWPLLPGNRAFYEWLSGFDSYYPGDRWDYEQVYDLLQSAGSNAGGPSAVLDVGSGKGDFLEKLDFLPRDRKYALDVNEMAVEACRKRGFHAFSGTIERAIQAGFLKKSTFPVVTSFHCLEHVDKPVDFVRSMAEVTAPGGTIFVSTPYSPMSFESDWFDILNHPPHHLTRWNLEAYRRLARMLNLGMRSYFPRSTALNRTVAVFRLLQYGPNRRVRKLRFVKDLMRHAWTLCRLYRRQATRPKSNGGVAADVILVELTVP